VKYLLRKVLKRLGLHSRFKTERIGNFMVTYAPSTDIGGKLYRGEQFEKIEIDIACQYINSNSTVLDIGANIGLHALNFSAVAKNGLVIACEPQPKTFKTLEKNVSQNNIGNIIPLNVAIADAAKIATFYVASDDAYSSLIDTGRKEMNEEIKVLCTTIDGLLGKIRIDFVKIDVEGLELSVLHSMSGLIQRDRPVIFCEIYKGNVDANNPHDTISYLEGMGYSTSRIIDGAMVEFCSGSQHEDQFYNYFFLPKN